MRAFSLASQSSVVPAATILGQILFSVHVKRRKVAIVGNTGRELSLRYVFERFVAFLHGTAVAPTRGTEDSLHSSNLFT